MYSFADFLREKNRIAISSLKGSETPDFSKLREIYQDVVFDEDFKYNPEDDDATFWKKCCEYVSALARRV